MPQPVDKKHNKFTSTAGLRIGADVGGAKIAGSILGRGLAGAVNFFDPEVIALGGGLPNIDRLYRAVPKMWGEWVFSDTVETALLRDMHGDSNGARDAAWLWPAESRDG